MCRPETTPTGIPETFDTIITLDVNWSARMAEELPRSQECQPEHLRLAVAAAGAALWAWNVDTDALSMDEHGFDLWGLDWAPHVTFGELSEHIHPADRD
jgi:hypothetical protein